MRYRGMKEIYSIVAVLIFLLAVFVSVVACTHWQEYDDGIRIFMAVMLCIPIVGLYFVISRLRHPSCYAEIRADGVHVFSRQAGELAFIDWKDVADYRYIKYDIDRTLYMIHRLSFLIFLSLKFPNPEGNKKIHHLNSFYKKLLNHLNPFIINYFIVVYIG